MSLLHQISLALRAQLQNWLQYGIIFLGHELWHKIKEKFKWTFWTKN